WDQTLGGSTVEGYSSVSVHGAFNGQFLVAATSLSDVSGNKTTANLGGTDLWIVKTAPETDCDLDGVLNEQDLCPGTPLGALVNANGCSLEQLCSCQGRFDSHEAYVDCVTAA